MINLTYVKQYCKDPIEWIENYQEAVNDQTQTWHCHHRFETEYNLSKIELQSLGFYFDRPFCELIFLTPKEHKRLHHIGKVGPWRGKHRSEETKQKMREAKLGKYKGENNPNYGKESPMRGKHHTEETKQKIREARLGTHVSEETKQKKTKFHISEEELYDLYISQGLSTFKIAKMYGCTHWCIGLKLKKYNIQK